MGAPWQNAEPPKSSPDVGDGSWLRRWEVRACGSMTPGGADSAQSMEPSVLLPDAYWSSS